MRCGRFENNIRGIDPSEFPAMPEVDGKTVIRAEAGLLRTAINQVVFAAATDDKRPILAGMLARFHNDSQSGHGRVTFAAADGFRLAVRTIPLPEPVTEPLSVIIPAKAMALLARTANAQESPISIHITPSKSQAIFHLENVELVAQLIDGTFPDYSLITPKKRDTRVVARTTEVLKACKAASVFARDSSNIVRFTVTPGNELEPGNVTVQATSAESGDNIGKVDANVEGPAIQIAFNVAYVIDALSAAGTEQVAIELTTPASPGMFRPVGQEDTSQCVIMPMNLQR
jgi:DNA polymerase-3 subunit beta